MTGFAYGNPVMNLANQGGRTILRLSLLIAVTQYGDPFHIVKNKFGTDPNPRPRRNQSKSSRHTQQISSWSGLQFSQTREEWISL